MSEWKKVALDKMGVVSRGKSKHRPRNDAQLFGGKYPFIQTGDIGAAELYVQNYSQTYNEEGLAQSKLWDKDTLCITIAANIADTALLAFPACFPDSVMGFVPYKNVSNVKFVKYCFDNLKKDCQQISQGTAQDNLSWKKLSTILFPCPPIEVQNRIVEILSRYDTLIENYQKQIKLLEEAAQRLYKEWFVESRFPGHENTKMVDGLPEGWERKKLGELVTKSIGGGWGKESPQEKYDKEGFVIRGTDISKLRRGNLDDIPFRYHTESNLKERTLSDGDLIFEVSGGSEKEPVGRMYLITQQILDFYKKDVICASFCKKVAFSNKCTSILCYFAMQYCRISGDMKKYEKDSAGNIINFAWTTFLEDFFVLLPNDEILEAFYKTAIDIINKQVNLALQIRLLTEARDRLLPRLMGGEIQL